MGAGPGVGGFRAGRWRLTATPFLVLPAFALAVGLLAPPFSRAPAGEVFKKAPPDYAVAGTLATSDGKSLTGSVYTTLGKPLTIYDRAEKRFVEFTLKDVSRIDVSVEEEHEEPVWRWKESGSDEKIFTGKSYPWKKYLSTVTFTGGTKIAGDLSGLVYVEAAGKKTRFVFYKRQQGDEGQALSDLVYVTSVVLGDKARASSAAPKEEPSPAAKNTSDKKVSPSTDSALR